MSASSSTTLDEILMAAQGRWASLVPETSGYLALAIGDAASRLPFRVDDRDVTLTTEGTVNVARGRDVIPPSESARLLRDVLGRLLAVSVGSMPGLATAARPRDESDTGMPSVIGDLECALIPVNRSAARRALARLAREVLRAKSSGKLKRRRAKASVAPPKPAAQPPARPATDRAASFETGELTFELDNRNLPLSAVAAPPPAPARSAEVEPRDNFSGAPGSLALPPGLPEPATSMATHGLGDEAACVERSYALTPSSFLSVATDNEFSDEDIPVDIYVDLPDIPAVEEDDPLVASGVQAAVGATGDGDGDGDGDEECDIPVDECSELIETAPLRIGHFVAVVSAACAPTVEPAAEACASASSVEDEDDQDDRHHEHGQDGQDDQDGQHHQDDEVDELTRPLFGQQFGSRVEPVSPSDLPCVSEGFGSFELDGASDGEEDGASDGEEDGVDDGHTVIDARVAEEPGPPRPAVPAKLLPHQRSDVDDLLVRFGESA